MKKYLIGLLVCLVGITAKAQSSAPKDSAITTKLRMESVRELEKNEDFQTALDVIKEAGGRAEFHNGTLTTIINSKDGRPSANFNVGIPLGGLGDVPQLHYQETDGKALIYFTNLDLSLLNSDGGGGPALKAAPCYQATCGRFKVTALTGCIQILQDLCHTDAIPPWSNVHAAILQRTCTCDMKPFNTFVQTIIVAQDCDCIQPL